MLHVRNEETQRGASILAPNKFVVLDSMVYKKGDLRAERDLHGEVQIPSGVYWGIQTARAKELFSISGLQPNVRLVDGMLLVKKACAGANAECGRLDGKILRGITQACDEALAGQWRDQFVVDPFQAGSGTALNANINEVIANRGAEILGGSIGAYEPIHPYKHVNLGQAANDVFPTAMRIAILMALREFEPALLDLERLLRRKSLEFERVIKVGRIHLQDSVPISLGQEFNAYGSSIERCHRRIREASDAFLELNIGATFVGTGVGTDRTYATCVVEKLSQFTNFRLRGADDPFRISQSAFDFLQFSSTLKELATELIKIANDLRLLSSGPRAGLSEITIPSSFQEPSNLVPETSHTVPALIESLIMVSFQILGFDAVVALATLSGQLESNVMTPIISYNILQSVDMLRNSILIFNQRCLAGITANVARCRQLLESSHGMEAILSQYVGRDKAVELVSEASKTGKDLKQIITEQNVMPSEALERLLHHKNLVSPGAFTQSGPKLSTTDNTSA